MDNSQINNYLKAELQNDLYNSIEQAIVETSKKHKFKRYEVAKLIMAIYNENYDYITTKNSYRQQLSMLNDYFKEKYNHHVISFVMLRKIYSYKGKENYNLLITDISSAYSIIKIGQNIKLEPIKQLEQFLENDKYDEIMNMIETDDDLKYAIAVIYDHILLQN